MVMLSGLLGFMLLGGIAFLPDVEPPISEEEEFEPDAPELEESAQPTDGSDLLWGRFLDDMIDGRGGDDQIHGYDGNETLDGADGNDNVIGGNGADVMTGGDGADTFVYTDVGDEPIEITDFDPTVDTMAIQFHENDVRDISVHPVSEDVYEIRLGDQVAAHVKSTVPFDASSILVQTHTEKALCKSLIFQYTRLICENRFLQGPCWTTSRLAP